MRVEFHKSKDRFEHVILAIAGERQFPVLISCEDRAANSLQVPCFQELHQQEQTLYLTGASSACHWSLSVQVVETQHFLLFDVAGRLKNTEQSVGSEYRVAEQLNCLLDGVNTSAKFADSTGNTPHLQLFSAKSSKNEDFSQPSPNCEIAQTDYGNLRLLASDRIPESLPATVQWRYAVGVC